MRRLSPAVLAPVLAVALASTAAAGDRDPALPRLALSVVTVAGVGNDVTRVMVDEASRLWRRAGVDLRWSAPGAPGDPPALRVLVVSSPIEASEGHTWPVAELRHDADTRPLALVSLEAAARVVDVGSPGSEPDVRRRHRLGLVLGRAVAHEIGHYLLSTPSHASHGLMRARIAPSDFADLRDGLFGLDRDATAAARRLLMPTLVAAAAPAVRRDR